MPGYERKDLEVALADHTLVVKGELVQTTEEKEKTFHLHERLETAFERRFTIPPEVDLVHFDANFEKVLEEPARGDDAEEDRDRREGMTIGGAGARDRPVPPCRDGAAHGTAARPRGRADRGRDAPLLRRRNLTVGSADVAFSNARRIVRFEDAAGIRWEDGIQGAIAGSEAFVTLANWVYIWGHWPVILSTALALFLFRRERYYFLRNAFFVSGVIGFLFFALHPSRRPDSSTSV